MPPPASPPYITANIWIMRREILVSLALAVQRAWGNVKCAYNQSAQGSQVSFPTAAGRGLVVFEMITHGMAVN